MAVSDQATVFSDDRGHVTIEETGSGMRRVTSSPAPGEEGRPAESIETQYPVDLIRKIFDQFGSLFCIDEIGRDTDSTDAALDVQYSVEAYQNDEYFQKPFRLLDYGSGSGASTMTLARLFPSAHVLGLEYVQGFVDIANARARFYGLDRVEFRQVDASGSGSPVEPATFDAAFLNAVYEHLLPAERPVILESIWKAMKPGSVLYLNQTPHRWFPIETHTTGLPLLNYLPRSMAEPFIRRFCSRVVRDYDWPKLLRAGVRGATVGEIMGHVHALDPAATLLRPIRIASSWPAIWYAAKEKRMHPASKLRTPVGLARGVVSATGAPVTPYINIAIRKSEPA